MMGRLGVVGGFFVVSVVVVSHFVGDLVSADKCEYSVRRGFY